MLLVASALLGRVLLVANLPAHFDSVRRRGVTTGERAEFCGFESLLLILGVSIAASGLYGA